MSSSATRAVRRPLAGWGRYPVEECLVYRPEWLTELAEIVTDAPASSLIARGLGRAYGDASLNRDAGVIDCVGLDRMQAFDPATGILSCEGAVSLAQIVDHFLPRGFFFPVTPGTKQITVGGAIAADVHGKNHHRDGSMSAFVVDLRLLTAKGEIVRCSRDENAELFWATVGGMGLTGIVMDARLRLRPVESAWLEVDYEKPRNLDDMLERISHDRDYAYAVAWVDCLARGASLGRGVLMRANPAPREGLPADKRERPYAFGARPELNLPFYLPSFTLNKLSMRLFNEAFYHGRRAGRRLTDYNSYFYPLDSIQHWNRGYGRRGVLQYQVLLPPEASREGLIEILEILSSEQCLSFLGVLKSFGEAGEGLLSFPRPGHTLSLDLPNTGSHLHALLRRLDELVLEKGGAVYLAKDSCLGADCFAAMYPNLDRFREVKACVDPENRFSSSMARRLGIVEGG